MRQRPWRAYVVLAAASFYGPVTLLAANAWEISSPLKPLVFGGLTSVLAFGAYQVVSRVTRNRHASATIVALGVIAIMQWRASGGLVLIPLFVAFVTLLLRSSQIVQRVAMYVLVAVFGAAPMLNLIYSHASEITPYPVDRLENQARVEATGLVEDVMIVVVDQYPSFSVAEEWFGHDPSGLQADLGGLGYRVVESARSLNTDTLLAVPSMLELRQVGRPGPITYDNLSSLMEIVRGDSNTSSSLRAAGFTYHHIESGWDGGACGEVDKCYGAPLFDELTFKLLEYSVFKPWLNSAKGSFAREGTLNSLRHLTALEGRLGDGSHDYIYGHLLLPHDPYVVGENCEILPNEKSAERVTTQLSCVDGLITQIAGLADDSTAVLITGDHGSNGLAQRGVHPDRWTDAQVAERLSVLLAYRLPPGCAEPDTQLTVEVVRSLLVCAVDIDLPPGDTRSLIGRDNARWDDRERVSRILATG